MGKNNKKKTVSSTRKVESVESDIEAIQKKEKRRVLSKLFAKAKKVRLKKPKKEKEAASARVEASAETAAELKAEAKLEAQEAKVETPKVKKTKKEREPLTHETKQKIRGGLLMLIGLFAVSFIGWFLFGKFFRAQSLAEMMPAQNTIGIFELNIDGANGQPKQFYELMKKYPVYQKDGLVKMLTLALPINFAVEIEPWLGRRAGITFLNNSGKIARYYFVESRDHALTLNFLKSRAMADAKEEVVDEDFNGRKIYGFTLSHRFEFTFLNNYLLIAENADSLKALLNDSTTRLSDDEDYRKVANNLPQGSLVFAYTNMQKMFAALIGSQEFSAKKGQDFAALKPFLSLFKAEGMTVFAEKDKFVVQTFESLDKEVLKESTFLTFAEKYQGSLLSLANEQPILLAGGHDLTKELNRLEEIFKGGTKTSSIIFNGLLEAQKENYFGKEISLKDDIYPLLTGEYLFTVDNNFEEPMLTMMFELANKNDDTAKIEKLASAFVKTSGIFSPKIQQVTLEDGTTGQEIVASSETVERFDEKYNDVNVTTLKIGNTGWAIYYTITGNKAVFTTNKDNLKNIVDRNEGKLSTNLTTTNFYRNILQSFLRTADEVINIKVGAITEATGMADDEILKPYVLPFGNLAITKNYFEDGISTIYLLEVI